MCLLFVFFISIISLSIVLHFSDAMKDFDGIDTSSPNCVVLGDAGANFSYENINKAFQLLIGMEHPTLITMGLG